MSPNASDLDSGVAVAPPAEGWLGAWETSTDPAYCRDWEGNLLAVNLPFARKFGLTIDSLVGNSVTVLMHGDDAASLSATHAALQRPPHRAISEHRWLLPGGTRWFTWEEVALRDSSGRIYAIRASGRDITRQHLAEEQFHRLSSAIEQSPVAIVITDLDGRPQYVNPKFTAVSGRTLEDLLDQNIEVLRDGHPDESSFEKFWQTVRAGGEWRGELSTRRGPGATVWESVKVSCLRNPHGEITIYLCLREDVTGARSSSTTCGRRTRWRASARSPAALRTISTTCSPSSVAMPNSACGTAVIPPCCRRACGKSAPPPSGPAASCARS